MAVPKPVSLSFNGNRWKYRRAAKIILDGERVDGICDWAKKLIKVDRSLIGFEEMETDVHEIDHAAHDYLHEDTVTPRSKEKAVAYWKLGYRKLTPDQRKQLGIL